MIKAVLFDLDNTLVDRDQAFHECVAARFGDPSVRTELFRLDRGGCGDREALFSYWERQAGMPMNQARFGRLLAEQLQPDRGLLQALRAHSRCLKLGIITNGGGETQRNKVHAAGLAEVIPPHRVWISAEVHKAKPDPAIFLLACQGLGAVPQDCLYIGDREQEDWHGATAAGLRARLVGAVLNRDRLNELIREEQRA